MGEEILRAINFLQVNDRNGMYEDMVQEYKDGDITVVEIKEYCLEVLNRWLDEDVGKDDEKGRREIEDIIKTLKG